MEAKSLTIKQILSDVHRRLAERARRNHHRLSSEFVEILNRVLDPDVDLDELLRRSDALTGELHFLASPEEIAAFRVSGRR